MALPISALAGRRGCRRVGRTEFYDYDCRIAVYAVMVDGGRILLTWFRGDEPNAPGWSLPGGGVEYHERVEERCSESCTRRPALTAQIGPVLGIDSITAPEGPRPPRPYKSVRIIYSAQAVSGVLGTTEVDGTTERAEWIELSELPRLQHADVVDIALAAWRTSKVACSAV